jgi:hypothetical protein
MRRPKVEVMRRGGREADPSEDGHLTSVSVCAALGWKYYSFRQCLPLQEGSGSDLAKRQGGRDCFRVGPHMQN